MNRTPKITQTALESLFALLFYPKSINVVSLDYFLDKNDEVRKKPFKYRRVVLGICRDELATFPPVAGRDINTLYNEKTLQI
jgi:hypothetical protein